MASLFGTSSPNTSVKKDKIKVIKIIEMVLQIEILKNGIHWLRVGASISANVSDANALDKNPAKVIPI